MTFALGAIAGWWLAGACCLRHLTAWSDDPSWWVKFRWQLRIRLTCLAASFAGPWSCEFLTVLMGAERVEE